MINPDLISAISQLQEADPRAHIFTTPHHTSLSVLTDILGLPECDVPQVTCRALASIVMLGMIDEKLKHDPMYYDAVFDDVIEAAFSWPDDDQPELYNASEHRFVLHPSEFSPVDCAFLEIIRTRVNLSGNQVLINNANIFFS